MCSGACRRLLLFLLVRPYDVHIFPNAARIVLRTRDNRIALIVESAAENFIFVAFARVGTEALDFIAGLRRPDAASLVATRRDNLVSLRVKRDFTDFILMALKDGRAGAGEDVVDARHSICAGCRQFVARAVEAGVEDFVVVPAELLNALARADIPEARRPIDRTRQAVVPREVKLAARELRRVAL